MSLPTVLLVALGVIAGFMMGLKIALFFLTP